MTVELIIKGEYVSNVLAQIQHLAQATGMVDAPVEATTGVAYNTNPVTIAGDLSLPEGHELHPSVDPEKTLDQHDIVEIVKTTTPEKLSRSESMKAVKEMVEGQFKDERYDLLSRGSQKKIDAAVAHSEDLIGSDDVYEAQKAEKETAGDTGGLFDGPATEPAPASVEDKADAIRSLMGEIGSDADGNPVQDNLVAIREILTTHIPDGVDTKISNIPVDKQPVVIAELTALKG